MTRDRIGGTSAGYAAATLRGREHPAIGERVVADLGSSLALGMSAGARPKKRHPTDPNEDAGAIARGSGAAVLVVADGHFGCEASEIVVEHVLGTLGPDIAHADVSDDDLVALFFDAGIAVQRAATRVGAVHPDSRTTLAFALVSEDAIQWAAIGDSCVLLARSDGCERLDRPRHAYLGQQFDVSEVAAALSSGTCPRRGTAGLVLATDGLLDSFVASGRDATAIVDAEVRAGPDASRIAERLIEGALRRGAADAVTVAVALTD